MEIQTPPAEIQQIDRAWKEKINGINFSNLKEHTAEFEAQMRKIAEDVANCETIIQAINASSDDQKSQAAADYVGCAKKWADQTNKIIANINTADPVNTWQNSFCTWSSGIKTQGRSGIAGLVSGARGIQEELMVKWILALRCIEKHYRNKEYRVHVKGLADRIKQFPKSSRKRIKEKIKMNLKTAIKKDPTEIINNDLLPVFQKSIDAITAVSVWLEEYERSILSNFPIQLYKKAILNALELPLIELAKILDKHGTFFTKHNEAAGVELADIKRLFDSIRSNVDIARQAGADCEGYIEQNDAILERLRQLKTTVVLLDGRARQMYTALDSAVKGQQLFVITNELAASFLSQKSFLEEYLQWWTTEELATFGRTFQ